jgi:uncharacterized coiled-coil protein SlyX
MPTTKDKIIELRSLATGAGQNLFRRSQLLAEVMADRDFIDSDFEGNEGDAREHFEAQYFSDVSGWVTVDRLIAIYCAYPNEEKWAACHYRLPDMVALFEVEHPKQKGEGGGENEGPARVAWKERATAAETRLKEVESQLRAKERTIAEQAALIGQMQRQIGKLEAMLDQMKAAEFAA